MISTCELTQNKQSKTWTEIPSKRASGCQWPGLLGFDQAPPFSSSNYFSRINQVEINEEGGRGGRKKRETIFVTSHILTTSHQVYWPTCNSHTYLMSHDFCIIQGALPPFSAFNRATTSSWNFFLSQMSSCHLPLPTSMLRTCCACSLYHGIPGFVFYFLSISPLNF